jgi:hypothetical protein
MGVLECDLFQGAGNAQLEACAVNDRAHIHTGENNRGPHVGKIQAALRKLGFSVSDPTDVFGSSTAEAVFKYKGPPRNILQSFQTIPDKIVGKQTIARLDREIALIEGKGQKPAPEFGSRNWRFTFFGNKGFTGAGIFSLFIGSRDLQDSQNFSIAEQSAGGSLFAGFKGEARGTFTTSTPIAAKKFQAARCELNLFKPLGSEFMQGSMRLLLIGDGDLGAFLPIVQLKDETLGTSVTTGNFTMIGQLRK